MLVKEKSQSMLGKRKRRSRKKKGSCRRYSLNFVPPMRNRLQVCEPYSYSYSYLYSYS